MESCEHNQKKNNKRQKKQHQQQQFVPIFLLYMKKKYSIGLNSLSFSLFHNNFLGAQYIRRILFQTNKENEKYEIGAIVVNLVLCLCVCWKNGKEFFFPY